MEKSLGFPFIVETGALDSRTCWPKRPVVKISVTSFHVVPSDSRAKLLVLSLCFFGPTGFGSRGKNAFIRNTTMTVTPLNWKLRLPFF